MNVGEIIKELQKYDPETMVVTDGYGGGLNEIRSTSFIRLNLYVNEWYHGTHEETQDPEGHPAIFIG